MILHNIAPRPATCVTSHNIRFRSGQAFINLVNMLRVLPVLLLLQLAAGIQATHKIIDYIGSLQGALICCKRLVTDICLVRLHISTGDGAATRPGCPGPRSLLPHRPVRLRQQLLRTGLQQELQRPLRHLQHALWHLDLPE